MQNASGTMLAATTLPASTFCGLSQEKENVAHILPVVPKAERLVKELHASLSEHQKSRITKPYDHPLRGRVENNWHILDERIGTFFEMDQQKLVEEIFLNLHSEEFRNQAWEQFISDNRNKKARTPDDVFGTASVALFASSDLEKMEFVFTGRHCTRRCDGNAEKDLAFGGPIFYGHAANGFYEKPGHPGNVYWFQAKRANELFEMLDPKQREKALKGDSRGEDGTRTVALKEERGKDFEGLPAYEMSGDQRGEMLNVVADLLKPFRKEDRDEALAMIKKQYNDIHLAFYKNEDVGNDKVWDTWQLEGPSMIWYFRGEPHVHAWVHVKSPISKKSKNEV